MKSIQVLQMALVESERKRAELMESITALTFRIEEKREEINDHNSDIANLKNIIEELEKKYEAKMDN